MKSYEIRKKFLEFFQKNQHKVMSGSDLILNNDPSLLFVNAGMNQFKDVFLGLKPPPADNAATIQKCLRVGGKHNDLEEVGATPLHHTFFEMLGSFSFGGYFKEKAIHLSWEFLTQELKIPEEHLWVTVHHEDNESYKIWKDQEKIPEHKIYQLGDKDNFWQMGEAGPCGYCSEIHYYKGGGKSPDPSQFIEIWNLVFMEFKQEKDGSRAKLPNPCVDTGMGLERLCAVLQDKKSNYHTDLFIGIIQELEKHCHFQYSFAEKPTDKIQSELKQSPEIQIEEIQKAFRVLADHSRAVSLLIAEAVRPGNQKEEYVLRRMIRRALYYSQKLQPKTNLLKEKSLLEVGAKKAIALMEEVNKELGESFKKYKRHFDFLPADKDFVRDDIRREEDRFSNSLKEGEKRLEEIIQTKKNKADQTSCSLKEKRLKIDKQTVWNLYSTYGFPMDLTRLMVKERGWDAPTEEEMEEYIKEYEQASKNAIKKIKAEESLNTQVYHIKTKSFLQLYAPRYISDIKKKIKKTDFTGHKKNIETGQIVFIGSAAMPTNMGADRPYPSPQPYSADSLKKEEKAWLILDKTCFYPEGGGPIGDKGLLKTETGQAKVLDCQKKDAFIWHEISVTEGELSAGQEAELKVDKDFRKQTAVSHSSTHLLNSALRSVLGDSVRQAGSLVEPGRLRFDFTFDRPLTKKELYQIEEKVYESIEKKETVSFSHKSFDEAKDEGALYLKGEDYGQDEVRVILMGGNTSKELCGGIHVENTKEIESFKIVSEKGVQSGVRRIIAYTGCLALRWERLLIEENLDLRKLLNSSFLKTSDFSKGQKDTKNKNEGISLLKTSDSSKGQRDIKNKNEGISLLKTSDSSKGQKNKNEEKTFIPLSEFCKNLTQIKSSSFKKIKSGGVSLWEGFIEKENPFVKILTQLESEIKKTKRNIIKWNDSESLYYLGGLKTKKKRAFLHPLADQNLELREYMKLPLPKEKDVNHFWKEKIEKELKWEQNNSKKSSAAKRKELSLQEFQNNSISSTLPCGVSQTSEELQELQNNNISSTVYHLFEDFFEESNTEKTTRFNCSNPLLEKFEIKKQELEKLTSQWEKIKKKGLKEDLIRRAVDFELKGFKGKLLVADFPIEDRKVLSDLSDSILSSLSSGILVLAGESEAKHPILVSLSKDFQNLLSAGSLLKNIIAPLCKGQGGGKAGFAQGSISDLSAFIKLEETLLEKIKQSFQ